jgi:DNA polymerase-3 subunit delta
LSPLNLASELVSGPLAPCYLLLGEERFLRNATLATLRTQLLGDSPGPSYQEFDGRKCELAPVLDEVRTFPFFGAGRRLVVVTDAGGQGGFVAKHADALVAYLAAPTDTSTLVLAADKLDARLKTTKALKAAAVIVDCGSPDEAGLLAFVRERAKAHGRPFARRADRALVEQLGGQSVALGVIDSEVQKLAGAGTGEITVADIQALCSFGSAEQSFGLIDRIGQGDVEGALTLLGRIFRDGLIAQGGNRTREKTGIAMILLPTLRWDLGRLLRAESLLTRGRPEREVTKACRVYRDQRIFLKRARRADKAELRRRHGILRDADVSLRSSQDPHGTMIRVVTALALSERGPVAARR